MALFVDLSNFYSHCVHSKLDDPQTIREFFLHWVDFDLLAKYLTSSQDDIWVFYSGEKFGPKTARVDGQYLKEFITRINSLKGVTARDVNIPGEQRETYNAECPHCHNFFDAQSVSEKGVDASLTVHLFDTIDSWDRAYILSGDADYVPAVTSLRRRGKIVIGVGFSNASAALVRECYEYIDITEFMKRQMALFYIFKKEGIAEKWLTSIPKKPQSTTGELAVGIYFDWKINPNLGKVGFYRKGLFEDNDFKSQFVKLQNDFDFDIFRKKDPGKSILVTFQLSPLDWEPIARRLFVWMKDIKDLAVTMDGNTIPNLQIKYKY